MEEFGNDRYNEGWKGGLAKGWAGGLAEGLAEGLADGEAKKAKETACELSKEGWTAEKIAKIVKYDAPTVEGWMKEYKASLS